MTSSRSPFVSIVCIRCGRTVRGQDLERIQPIGRDGYACWHCHLIDMALGALWTIAGFEDAGYARILADQTYVAISAQLRPSPAHLATASGYSEGGAAGPGGPGFGTGRSEG